MDDNTILLKLQFYNGICHLYSKRFKVKVYVLVKLHNQC